MRWVIVWIGILLVAGPVQAAVVGKTVEYKHGDTVLEGYVAYDDAATGKRPGVLVVHEWKGLNEYAQRRARMLAELGYVAFAADMYGKGVRAKDHEEAAKLSGIYRNDRNLMRGRIGAALDWIRAQSNVDFSKIAAVGYCFGGSTVLELARSGADILGVASFHGGLKAPTPAAPGAVKAKLLVLHGADDSFIPAEEVDAFKKEMEAAGVDYKFIAYPGAVHSFTVEEAGDDPSKGMAYNAEADQKSWAELKRFLAQLTNQNG